MAVFLSICMVYMLVLVMRDQARLHHMELPEPKRVYLVPDHKWMRGLALGYNEAVADVVWIEALVYVGGQAAIGGRYEMLDGYIELILAMDPHYRRAYQWAGVISIYSERQIKRRRIEKAIEYLKRGIEVFPYDGKMQSMLAFDLYYELPPYLESAEARRKSKLEGLDHFKQAVLAGDQPDWLVGLISTLYKRNGEIDMAIRSIEENLKFVNNEETRKQLLARLEALQGKRDVSDEVKQIQEFYARWGRDYPYMPLDFYLLLQPKLLAGQALQAPVSEVDSAMQILDDLSMQ